VENEDDADGSGMDTIDEPSLLALAAIRAPLLAVPGDTVTTMYRNDLFVAGVCRVTSGQMPNLDFHAADDALDQEAAFGGNVRHGLPQCVRASELEHRTVKRPHTLRP
jgi:hypothetical protein